MEIKWNFDEWPRGKYEINEKLLQIYFLDLNAVQHLLQNNFNGKNIKCKKFSRWNNF